jgi:hypothetical protein
MKIFISSLVLPICLLTSSQSISSGAGTAQSPVQIKVSAPRSWVCVGDKAISLDIVVINEGQSKVSFDSHKMQVNVAYGALFDTTTFKRRTEAMSVQQDRIPVATDRPGLVELEKNQAYTRHASLPLPTPFFSQPGFYLLMPAVSIDIFSIQSDPKTGIIFELRDCE